jgi:hypothetical protein
MFKLEYNAINDLSELTKYNGIQMKRFTFDENSHGYHQFKMDIGFVIKLKSNLIEKFNND